jgi:hypothetical protein
MAAAQANPLAERPRADVGQKGIMAWYVAHTILAVKFKEGLQRAVTAWENVVLVQADSDGEAVTKAEYRARDYEGDAGGTFSWEGRPARWEYAGIRKIIRCPDEDLRDGSELTFSYFVVPDEQALRVLVEGDAIDARYEE